MKTVAILAFPLMSFLAALAPAAPPAQSAAPATAEFFEAHVRPILVEHCLACHGPKKQKGGLRLDSRQAVLQGGDDGPALVAGQPDQSALIRAVRRQGDVKMPPKKPLTAAQVTTLASWVKMGAPWPETTTHAATRDSWKTHWAFQPIHQPALPAVKDRTWVQSPIDAFVLARLEARGWRPARPADRRTLLRRVTFDLIGLPPTPAEIAAFEADRSPQAFERVVDRLLASPHYGERWGRYWLDVARYADTKGYVFDQDRHFPCSYSYRDYVIGAFNRDLPYNRFILEQLAADQLPLGGDREPLAAMGFLTLGNRFMNNRNDIIDDQIDVVTRGLLGLTVACARCHDHKYDPIPSKDYYSLYGVFRSSTEPRALPVIAEPRRTAAYAAYEKQLAVLEGKLGDFLKVKHQAYAVEWRTHVADYLMQVYRHRHQPNTRDFMFVIQPGQVNPKIIQRWRDYLARSRHGHDPVFAPWNAFFALADKDFQAKAPALAARFAANHDPAGPINPLVARLFAGAPPATMQEVANRYGKLFADTEKQWQKSRKEPAGPERAVWQVLHGPDTPTNVPLRDIRPYVLDRPARNTLTRLRNAVEQFKGTSPAAPPRAMILRDAPTPYAPHVFVRGNPGRPGAAVPRQFLAVLSGPHRQPFRHGSGRLELAQAIVAPTNPLTARVIVNRIWLHHFGAGLVRTPSDFGMRSDPPTHPALLDYLAARFMDEGWSIKKLHRLILLSSTYQQSSDTDPAKIEADPDNRLLAHVSRQRLDFEAMRDGLLAVSGKLEDEIGGYPVRLTAPPFSGRRTVYGYIDRLDLPSVYRTFDFPNPDSSSPERPQTSVPLQALFLMNSPFVVDQARHLVQRPEIAREQQPAARVRALYQLLFGRPPDADELALATAFVHHAAASKAAGERLTPWEKYAQVLLLSNEFAFVD